MPTSTYNPWVLARADVSDHWQIVGRFHSFTQAQTHGKLIQSHQVTATTIWYEILSLDWFEDEIQKVMTEKAQWHNALKRVCDGKPTEDLIGIAASNLTVIDCQIEIAHRDRVMLHLLDSLIYWGLSRGLSLDWRSQQIRFAPTQPQAAPLWRVGRAA